MPGRRRRGLPRVDRPGRHRPSRTRAAALDYAAQNIRVNAVYPGYIDTPMMGRFTGGTPEGRAKVIAEEPIGRMGKPEETAAALIWLYSDAAAFMVGHAMVIDGGQTVQ
jgi:NAD(P)-dependent dehydrogenase (short-subunit alcohol dehydrogenase family)